MDNLTRRTRTSEVMRGAKAELISLEEEKKNIEKELDEAFLVLTNNNVGMDDPLVDAEDYPRADISVYEILEITRSRTPMAKVREEQLKVKVPCTGDVGKGLLKQPVRHMEQPVRHARAKIIRLRNDLGEITKRIGEALDRYHQANPVNQSNAHAGSQPKIPRKRLAKVDFIEEGSPAAICGLLNGDFILEIGNVNEENFKGLEDIANAVKSSENYYMKVVVERGSEIKRINLKPKIWAGPNKGLLGCKIVLA